MTPNTLNCDFIESTLSDDPDLAELVELFVDEMPAKVASLVEARRGNDRELFQRLVHQLKGSAGSYGFASISAVAGKLESLLKTASADEPVEALMISLTEMCGRVRSSARAPMN